MHNMQQNTHAVLQRFVCRTSSRTCQLLLAVYVSFSYNHPPAPTLLLCLLLFPLNTSLPPTLYPPLSSCLSSSFPLTQADKNTSTTPPPTREKQTGCSCLPKCLRKAWPGLPQSSTSSNRRAEEEKNTAQFGPCVLFQDIAFLKGSRSFLHSSEG